jgi:probable phosphoglycerate mutase
MDSKRDRADVGALADQASRAASPRGARRALQSRFDRVTYQWIPRERSRHADALAERAMDAVSFDPRPRSTATRRGGTSRRHGAAGSAPAAAMCPCPPSGGGGAAAVACRVAALGPVAAVSSPLLRCTETAALLGVPVSVDEDLIECDFGVWDGMTFAEVRESHQAELDTWLASTDAAPPGGESFTAVALRVSAALARTVPPTRTDRGGRVARVPDQTAVTRRARGDGRSCTSSSRRGRTVRGLHPDGGVAVHH